MTITSSLKISMGQKTGLVTALWPQNTNVRPTSRIESTENTRAQQHYFTLPFEQLTFII